MSLVKLAIDWTEQGLVPDAAIRAGIRRLLRRRLEEIQALDTEAASERLESFVSAMAHSEIAMASASANDQHYEIPAAFYGFSLGRHRKYSCCYWPAQTTNLDTAEAAALRVTCERAGLSDGINILELGCGWGSLTLWMARQFPRSRITAVSNSLSQRDYILAAAKQQALDNIEVITRDMNDFDTERRFERIVSVEMFEHMRNWPELFARIHRWLMPGGRFFLHVFVHRSVPYSFDVKDPSDWMSRHFFTGGMMPSDDLALRIQSELRLIHRWRWDGTHYEKTANAWLANLDAHRADVLPILAATYGDETASHWLQRWRIFFMACAELFGYEAGQQWWVSHYLFERPARDRGMADAALVENADV